MHLYELQHMMEHRVRQVVERHYPLDWKEDAITHDLVIRLRSDFRRVTLRGLRSTAEIEWEAYKLHGAREQAHGDIGLLVRYRLPSSEVVEGAGFLEAKVRGRDSTKFHAVRHEQVARLLARSPQTRLAMYDYNPVTVLDAATFDEDWDRHLHPRFWPGGDGIRVSSAPVLPLQLAATINHFDDTLYRFAHSFSHQMCRRYFCLHDLDFSEPAIQAVKGFPTELGSPNIVLVVRIAGEDQELPETLAPQERFSVLE